MNRPEKPEINVHVPNNVAVAKEIQSKHTTPWSVRYIGVIAPDNHVDGWAEVYDAEGKPVFDRWLNRPIAHFIVTLANRCNAAVSPATGNRQNPEVVENVTAVS